MCLLLKPKQQDTYHFPAWITCTLQVEKGKERKEKLRRLQDAPCINKGKEDTLARSAASLIHRWKR